MTQRVNGCKGIFLYPLEANNDIDSLKHPHIPPGACKNTSLQEAKEQINLNTGFGRAKFKLQQEKRTHQSL